MARNRLRRISFLTEREVARASKSGMRFHSPMVRGLECAAGCSEVLAAIGPPSPGHRRMQSDDPPIFNSVQAHCHPRGGAGPLLSVDAAPSPEDTRAAA